MEDNERFAAMDESAFGKIARKKFGAVSENFHIFYAGWMGNPESYEKMKVKGAEFKSNKRVPFSTMETIVTAQELAQFRG
jgi:hypothetical protein